MTSNLITVLIILAVLGAAIAYIVRAKKRGVKCIGCPAGESCASKGDPTAACSACGDIDEIVQQIKGESQTEKEME